MLFVDLFCGAGGTTSGIEHAKIFNKKAGRVIACVNHDKNAIASHISNHPHCLHFTEDIRTLDLTELVSVAAQERINYPAARMCLWASLECTNFSKAKGGLPRDADSRTLAEHLFRYLDAVDFDYIFIENVEEFMAWGPLDKLGKPVSKKRGQDYVKWINEVQDYGFAYEFRILNAADYGAHTSRKRYFGVFAKHGLPIRFPIATHSKKGDSFSGLKKWLPVKEVLDFEDEGESIFMRKKPLSDRTMERIYAGLVKFVAKGDTSFIQKYYSGRPWGKVNSTEEPSPTVTSFGGMTLVQPTWLLKYNSMTKDGKHVPPSVDEPSPALTPGFGLGLVQTKFLTYYYGNGYESSVNAPVGTLRTKDTCQLVQPEFLVNNQGKSNAVSIESPSPTLLTKDKLGLVHTHWIDRPFTQGGGKVNSVDQPAGAILPVPKMNLVDAWLLSPHYNNAGTSTEDPAPTITAQRKHHCLMFPQWGIQCSHSIDKPSPVLPARMDKMYPYLIQADESGEPIAIAVYETDREVTKKIKMFMAAYGIVDIKRRMLRIKELKLITGFPESYVLKGTQQDQKKYIGNAVPVKLAQAIIESFAQSLAEPLREELAA